MSLFRRGAEAPEPELDPIAIAQRLDAVFTEFAIHHHAAGLIRWLTVGPLRVGGQVELEEAEFYTVVASIEDRAVELNLPIFGVPSVIVTGRVGDRSVDFGEAWGGTDLQFTDDLEIRLGDRWPDAIAGARRDDSAAAFAEVDAWLRGTGAAESRTVPGLRVGLVEAGGRRMVVPPEFVGEAIDATEPKLAASDIAGRVPSTGWHVEQRRLH